MLPPISEDQARKRYCILEHGHPPEAFWGVFDGVLQILQDGLLTYRFFDSPLCLDIKGICIETRYLYLPTSLLIGSKGGQIPQEFCEPPRI